MSTDTAPFEVGDLVTCGYDRFTATVVRRVTAVTPHPKYESGWAIAVDGGDRCPHCGRSAEPLRVDAGWFRRVE